MRVKVKRKEGESTSQLLKRFLSRYAKSGIALEVKSKMYRLKPENERLRKERKLYRLKLQSFIRKKIKEGWPFQKAYDLAKRYVNHIKYEGGNEE